MSRGIIILIVVLSLALAGLLLVPRLKRTDAVAPTPTPVAAIPSNVTPTTQISRPATSIGGTPPANVPSMSATGASLAVRSNIAQRVLTMVTNEASITNLLDDPPMKPLPELERDYASTTNRDTRLDVMMDISEAGTADSVKSLTRLFDLETDPDLKVDLLDSLLGIEGFKDEKLIMLTLGVRQGLPSDVRQSAIDGLIDLEDTRSIALLNGLLNDPDPEIRQSAQDAIEILQTPVVQLPKLTPKPN